MLVALLGAAPAQDPPPLRERALDMLHKTLRNQGAYRTLQGLVRHAPKRLAGSPGAAAAVEWARQQMTSIGLADVRLEEVVTNRWVRGTVCRVTALVGGADISPLGPSGVPLMSLRSADHRYFDVHHSAKDTIEQVHPRELSLGAGALAICAFAVADSAGTLPRANQ